MKTKVAIAMSGGVDSSVAAALLQEQGCEVFGLTGRMWPEGSRCCSDEDIRDARRVADFLGIPHYVVDLHEVFGQKVVEYFAFEYASGRTPSPCAVCNRYVKFGELLDKALRQGAGHLATGHYARVREDDDGSFRLMSGCDVGKDQSYFLFDLSQKQLKHALFPLGEMTKKDVRKYAHANQIPVADRGESQDLCFVDAGEHHLLVEKLRPGVCKAGNIVDKNGVKLARHQGIHRYTIGQRRGVGIAAGKPVYVAKLDAGANTVVVGARADLMSAGMQVKGVRWTSGKCPPGPVRVCTMIRYNHDGAMATVDPVSARSVNVVFDEPQFAVTPGQVAAFYDGDELFGGGWIDSGFLTIGEPT